jgi:AcrR family transcriptional regulator
MDTESMVADSTGGSPVDGGTGRRRRNPRGQGERLRADIIEAASRLVADPAAPPLTLRGVAREVGVAATSVYLHFADIDELVLAIADRHIRELIEAQQAALDAAATPEEAVLAMSLAYCEFGLSNPGLYQVMFGMALPQPPDPRQFAGWTAHFMRTKAIEACVGDPGRAERASVILWQLLHGTVSLRISRSVFPWPPYTETVTDAVKRIVADPA